MAIYKQQRRSFVFICDIQFAGIYNTVFLPIEKGIDVMKTMQINLMVPQINHDENSRAPAYVIKGRNIFTWFDSIDKKNHGQPYIMAFI